MRLGKKKRCGSCGQKVSRPHLEGCSNDRRDCKFKKNDGNRTPVKDRG